MEENKTLVRALIDAINRRDFDVVDALVTNDVSRHSRATPGLTIDSRAAFRAFLEADAATFPDARQELLLLIAEGDLVAARVRLTGTQEGPFGPHPATGRRVDTEFQAMLRIADGRIAEMWVEWDNMAILGQLGLLPG